MSVKAIKSVILLGVGAAALAAAPAWAGRQGWGGWSDAVGSGHGTVAAAVVVPAGSATYSGTTVAIVRDSSSGTAVQSLGTGAISLNVAFSGTGTTTQTGTISALTGTAGTTLGTLTIAGTGTGSRFNGTLTSSTATTGTGTISGGLSAPVVSGTTVSAPLAASGRWGFGASSTLTVQGQFLASR